MFSLFSLEEFRIALYVFVDRSRNVGSWGIDIHSSFRRHRWILWFYFFEYETVETIAIYEETSEEQNDSQRHLNHNREKEKWYVYQDSKQKEKPELGFLIQRFSHLIVAQPDFYLLCFST